MNWWLREHFSDTFVKQARKEGQRARACYKLAEIDLKYHLIHPNQLVIDLGAAPGSWSQYLVNKKINLKVIAVDLLPFKFLSGVSFIQGDFNLSVVRQRILNALEGKAADLVLSDMAPNLSGIKVQDQAKTVNLARQAFAFAQKTLRPGGDFLLKLFQGEESSNFEKELTSSFSKILRLKPEASRRRSNEIFLLARNFHQTAC